MLPSYSLDNLYTSSDLHQIKELILANSEVKEFKQTFEGPFHNKIVSKRHIFDWDQHKQVSDIILDKFPVEVKNTVIVDHSYLLQSYAPYEIHCDYNWVKCNHDETPYYFAVIPLETVEANTVVLDQHGPYTHFIDYKNNNKPLSKTEWMPEEEYKKYFSHTWDHERHWVSIHKIFKWQEGSLFLGDIRRFHCSDNFLVNGVRQKECIILFTKTK